MYKNLARQKHFQEITGSSSTRATSRGVSDFGTVDLQPNCIAQLSALVDGRGNEDQFKSTGGHLRKLLHQEQRDAFEAIFLQVANARLPKDVFLAINEEARAIWRREYAELVPPDFKHLKKIRRLRRKQQERGAI